MVLITIQFSYWLLLAPVVAAITGWLIHTVALYVLFHKILPQKKSSIALQLGKLAAKEFSTLGSLEEKINDPKNLENVLPVIETHIDRFLNEKLKQEMPMISMFIGSKTTDKLKEVFMKEIQLLFPQVISKFAGNLTASLDIERMIASKIDNTSTTTIEKMARQHLASEIRTFRLLGLITGFIAGLLALLITVATSWL